jgi:hypothetical protein
MMEIHSVADLSPQIRSKILVDDCWIWNGYVTEKGYGRIYTEPPNTMKYVHRIVYELLIGPVPKGKELHHKCLNKHCCNPNHLEVLTRSEHCLLTPGGRNGNGNKTHCPQGHPYDEANTLIKRGRRHCRICWKEADRQRYRRQKGQVQ